MTPKRQKKIVIIGMGDTGVLVAAHLTGSYEVIGISTKLALVSGQELGARLTKPEAWKENYLVTFDRFERLDTVKIIQGSATGIDLEENTIHVTAPDGQNQNLDYDVLVIASGTGNGFWRTSEIMKDSDVQRQLDNHALKLAQAPSLTVIGAGPTGVSVASHTKETFPEKNVTLIYRGQQILSGYSQKARNFVEQRLVDQGVVLCSAHSVSIPPQRPLPVLEPGTITFKSGQAPVEADCVLWAIGDTTPHNDFIPEALLTDQGFVDVNSHLQSTHRENIFAIGDIAASDPNRSSARNAGFQTVATNIDLFLDGQANKMKSFRAPEHRWGSILGIQNEGMRIFTPKGGNIKVRPWAVKNILFPVFVRRLIYRGMKSKR